MKRDIFFKGIKSFLKLWPFALAFLAFGAGFEVGEAYERTRPIRELMTQIEAEPRLAADMLEAAKRLKADRERRLNVGQPTPPPAEFLLPYQQRFGYDPFACEGFDFCMPSDEPESADTFL